MARKKRKIIAAVVLVFWLINLIVSGAQLYISYAQPKEKVTLPLGRLSENRGSSFGWEFEAPGQILTGDIVYGNLTLCCIENLPSQSQVPVLYILTFEQHQTFQTRNGVPTQFVATTGFGIDNYTFSGPMKSHILGFRFRAPSTTTYYFWFLTRGTSSYTLDVYAIRVQGRSIDLLVATWSVISAFLAVVSLIFVRRK